MGDSLRLRQPPKAITAAATLYRPEDTRGLAVATNTAARAWQEELWYYWRTQGEFNQATDWESRANSLMRLVAAEVVPGGDEPEPLSDGPAAQFMEDFAGGGPGQSTYLRAASLQLVLPGEWWTVVEQDPREPLNLQRVTVVAPSCLRPGTSRIIPSGEVVRWPEIRIGEGAWRPVADDHLLFRTWQPDGEWPWLATSNAQAAIPILRRIELIDKRIIAMMVSRLAMNGIWLIPEEGTIGVPAQYKDAPDPFVRMLVDVARTNIADPGSASAAIPIPVKFNADLIEKWREMKPQDPLDEHLLQDRIDELGRLGDTMGIARERVSGGMSGMNQWSAAVISEEEVRITFGPMTETICDGLTTGYLHPLLRLTGQPLIGPNGGRIVAWYDSSRLTAKVDKFDSTLAAYDRFEADGAALRREAGLSESDKPEGAERAEQILLWQARQPETTVAAAAELGGPALPVAESPAGVGEDAATASPVSQPSPPAPAVQQPGRATQPTTRDAERTTNPAATVAAITARMAVLEQRIPPQAPARGRHRSPVRRS